MAPVLQAVLWGVVQGITEFLPISSDGHLVLIPALFGFAPPDLATTAVLHLGTLGAVVAYFRRDLWRLRLARSDPGARRLLWLLFVGSLPAGLALLFVDEVERLQRSVTAAALFLLVTGLVLVAVDRLTRGGRDIAGATPTDAVLIGFAQLLAILPGISRSGFTIAAGMARGFERVSTARFSFLLGVPAIAAAGLLELFSLTSNGGVPAAAWVGVAVAGVTGYLAIAFLLQMLQRTGLSGYGIYCLALGALALFVL
ncbi:MAG TPA: undecaprenyl-diphosphate phosphatase [Acidimicrobiia bacterium]|nr:undecaprenyl-diphosphate phosphatase [Acidimicrobiia bacterium]